MRRPERKTNGKWQIRFPDQHGRIRYATFATKKEAEAGLRERYALLDAGLPVGCNVRFDELADEWRSAHLTIDLRSSTRKDYEAALRPLREFFGRRSLRTITPTEVERFRNEMLDRLRHEKARRFADLMSKTEARVAVLQTQGRAAQASVVQSRLADLRERSESISIEISRSGQRTVNKSLATLRMLLNFGVDRGYIGRNAAARVKKYKAGSVRDRPIDQHVLAPQELQRLLDHTDRDWRPALGILAYGGLRLGELLGLQWGDVEFDRGRILVRRQLEAVSGELREPKTKAGTRFVELPSFVMRDLREWRLRCPPHPLALCFPDRKGGPMDDRNFRTRVFYPALRRAGLRRIRVHDLRHGAASMLIATGADLAAISRQLGHANVNITLTVYAHWFARRTETGLGARLEALALKELGCDLVAPGGPEGQRRSQVLEKMVARVGIEPTTRGFSVRCSTN